MSALPPLVTQVNVVLVVRWQPVIRVRDSLQIDMWSDGKMEFDDVAFIETGRWASMEK